MSQSILATQVPFEPSIQVETLAISSDTTTQFPLKGLQTSSPSISLPHGFNHQLSDVETEPQILTGTSITDFKGANVVRDIAGTPSHVRPPSSEESLPQEELRKSTPSPILFPDHEVKRPLRNDSSKVDQPFPLVEWIKSVRADTLQGRPLSLYRRARPASNPQRRILDSEDAWFTPLIGRTNRIGALPLDISDRYSSMADEYAAGELVPDSTRQEKSRDESLLPEGELIETGQDRDCEQPVSTAEWPASPSQNASLSRSDSNTKVPERTTTDIEKCRDQGPWPTTTPAQPASQALDQASSAHLVEADHQTRAVCPRLRQNPSAFVTDENREPVIHVRETPWRPKRLEEAEQIIHLHEPPSTCIPATYFVPQPQGNTALNENSQRISMPRNSTEDVVAVDDCIGNTSMRTSQQDNQEKSQSIVSTNYNRTKRRRIDSPATTSKRVLVSESTAILDKLPGMTRPSAVQTGLSEYVRHARIPHGHAIKDQNSSTFEVSSMSHSSLRTKSKSPIAVDSPNSIEAGTLPATSTYIRSSNARINATVLRYIHEEFSTHYPSYRRELRAFTRAMNYLISLRDVKREPHPYLFDDFIYRYSHDFKEYRIQCAEQEDDELPYVRFYHDRVTRPNCTLGVITPATLDELLLQSRPNASLRKSFPSSHIIPSNPEETVSVRESSALCEASFRNQELAGSIPETKDEADEGAEVAFERSGTPMQAEEWLKVSQDSNLLSTRISEGELGKEEEAGGTGMDSRITSAPSSRTSSKQPEDQIRRSLLFASSKLEEPKKMMSTARKAILLRPTRYSSIFPSSAPSTDTSKFLQIFGGFGEEGFLQKGYRSQRRRTVL